MNRKELALQIAEKAFEGKTDKAGQPYINHLKRVANKFISDEIYTVAILHDLLEDCPEWTEKYLKYIFEDKIVNAIVVLTKQKGEDYFDYIYRIKKSYLGYVRQIKIQDLLDNMDITRLETITENDVIRLNKYLKAYKILTE